MNHSGRHRAAAAACALLLLSVSVCLLFVSRYPFPEVKNDAVGYLAAARNIAAGKGFTADGITPMVYRPPLFSVLLGGWFFLTRTSSVLSAAVFQSVLHALGVTAAFLLFLEVGTSLAWAAGAALFLCVNPLLVTRAAFVLQEPTLILFTTLAVWLSVRLIKSPSAGRAALAGVAWGLCTLGKVVAWFAPFLLLAMRFLPARVRWRWRRREAVLLLLCFAAVVSPWTVRNYLRFHRFIPVNAQLEGMLAWNVRMATIPGEPPGAVVYEEIQRSSHTERERTKAMYDYVRNHPRYFLIDRVIRNAVRFATPPPDWWVARGDFALRGRRTAFWVLAALFQLPLYLFLLYRSAQWLKGRTRAAFGFPLLFYWAYWAEHALIWGDPRFGLAVYPLLVAMVLPLERPPGAGGGTERFTWRPRLGPA